MRRHLMLCLVLGACGTQQPVGPDDWPDLEPAGQDAGTVVAPEPDAGDTGQIQSRLYKSGTRLKARVLETGDGAQQFLGWFDSELGVKCEFATAPDGKTRCLPRRHVRPEGLFYLDQDCSREPIIFDIHKNLCGEPEYVLVEVPEAVCPKAPISLWFIRDVVLDPEKVYFRESGQCGEIPRPSGKWYRLVPVDPSAFAEGRERVE